MNQSDEIRSNSAWSFVVSFFLFLTVIFISSTPVLIEQLNKPERLALKLLSRSGTWQVIHQSTSQSAWEASDGFIARQVSHRPTSNGIEIVIAATDMPTREAYFNKEAITANAFKLSTEVDTPNGCHNGLVFRGNAQGEYYLFLVSQVSYTVEILRRESNADLPREALIPNTRFPAFIERPHTITVLGDGPAYFFYIDNTLVNYMRDSRLTGNRTGVEVFT